MRQQILMLAWLAFYCGIGYKTAMGLGQVRLISRFKFFNEINVDYVDNKELLLHYFVLLYT